MQEESFHSNGSSQINFRSKGMTKSGRLVRGVVQSAHKKMLTSVIPTKFETIVIKNQPRKGFGTTTQRFVPKRENSAGPGSYLNSTNTTMDSTVYSKHGLGNGFISKVQRNVFSSKYINTGPGPDQYLKPKPSLYDNLYKELEKKTKIVQFHKNDQKIIKKEKQYVMGPGDYNPQKKKIFQNTFTSAFVTKLSRDQYIPKKAGPGPGTYPDKRDIYEPKLYHTGEMWFQRKPTVKPQKPMQELMKFIQESKKPETVQEESKQNDKEHWMFQQGNKNRFGDKGPLINDQNLGPGTYNSQQFYSIEQKHGEKNYVTSNIFMSETERKPYNIENRLGPSYIVPFLPPPKKSMHLNINNIWSK